MNGSFFSSDSFMPHGHCYLWRPEILWLHVISDFFIFLAYMAIPVVLLLFLRKRRNFPHRWIMLMFALFIVCCGLTHLASIWTVWRPDYGWEGILKAITAAISIATAVLLVPLVPKALQFLNRLETGEDEKSPAHADVDKY